MQVCMELRIQQCCNVFLNPWDLRQLSIQLKIKNTVQRHQGLRQSRGDKCLMCFSRHLRKFAMLVQLALLLLCYGVGNVRCVHENSIDLHALLDFKQSTSDPNGALSSWNISIHYCRWSGVTCTLTRPWRVSGLNLTGRSLAGEITPSLANLTLLSVLDLSDNRFSGQLPPLDGLQLLQELILHHNSLEGTIPDALTNFSNLVDLELDHNQLSGAIPPKIGLLSNLEILDISSNNLTGEIPPTIANLTRLYVCSLRTNQLEGSIPDAIWQMPNMGQLVLGSNSLSGMIPAAINMSQLIVLGLESNMLGKALPSNFGYGLPSLDELVLHTNMFEGHIPASLGNYSSLLNTIDLSANHFTGQIPASLGRLSNLFFLSLEFNQVETGDSQSWEFLKSLSNCKNLDTLTLFDNRLQGVIPDFVGNLSVTLEYLILGQNNLSGMVPATIGNLRNLLKLNLEENNLSGLIGEWIGNLKKLQGFSLSGNNFTGPIPSSIGNLTQLSVLRLQNNEFEGLIPPSLEYMSQLSTLNLSYNNLQGNIPLGVGSLVQLIDLYLSSNKLTGGIPDSLGQCHNLATIEMDQNFLTGDIPPSFSSLENLVFLNLSHNNLSGSIPITLNNLTLLQKLDLSYNDLQGQIPRNGVFADATVISLNGNKRLCGGVADLHMPLCPTVSHKSERQYYLVRVLIPLFGFMSLVLLVYMLILVKKAQRRKYTSLTSLSDNFLKVSYNDLAQATSNFSESNLVGRGSYGTVYRGKLKEHKTDLAVKVFNLEMHGAERSFMSECEALRSIQHRNLLPIITACSTVDNGGIVFKALIYEYMPNGNLDTWLHHKGEQKAPTSLGLTQRISIAVNVADALDYLHHDCGRTTIHCDLKPCNILLDDDMTALLADFGIARFYVDCRSASSTASISSIGVKGTIGYIAPEYAGGGHPSTSGDVYSFGIVLLEILTGKRPTDPMFKDGLDIVNFVESNFPHQISKVIDDHLIEECKDFSQRQRVPENVVNDCISTLLQVALSCVRLLPGDRMNMKQIASKLHEIKASHLGWKK